MQLNRTLSLINLTTLRFLAAYEERHGQSTDPLVASNWLIGPNSRATYGQRLYKLREMGLVTYPPNRTDEVLLTDDGHALLAQVGKSLPDSCDIADITTSPYRKNLKLKQGPLPELTSENGCVVHEPAPNGTPPTPSEDADWLIIWASRNLTEHVDMTEVLVRLARLYGFAKATEVKP